MTHNFQLILFKNTFFLQKLRLQKLYNYTILKLVYTDLFYKGKSMTLHKKWKNIILGSAFTGTIALSGNVSAQNTPNQTPQDKTETTVSVMNADLSTQTNTQNVSIKKIVQQFNSEKIRNETEVMSATYDLSNGYKIKNISETVRSAHQHSFNESTFLIRPDGTTLNLDFLREQFQKIQNKNMDNRYQITPAGEKIRYNISPVTIENNNKKTKIEIERKCIANNLTAEDKHAVREYISRIDTPQTEKTAAVNGVKMFCYKNKHRTLID